MGQWTYVSLTQALLRGDTNQNWIPSVDCQHHISLNSVSIFRDEIYAQKRRTLRLWAHFISSSSRKSVRNERTRPEVEAKGAVVRTCLGLSPRGQCSYIFHGLPADRFPQSSRRGHRPRAPPRQSNVRHSDGPGVRAEWRPPPPSVPGCALVFISDA
jgi:hypothetical protein